MANSVSPFGKILLPKVSLLRVMTLLHIYTYVNVQQTPNPAAQFPSIEPPLLEHSDEVKHVPYIALSDLAVHWLGGKAKVFKCQFFNLYLISSILVWESNNAE